MDAKKLWKTEHTETPWVVVSGAIETEDERPIARMVRDDTAVEAEIHPVERDQNAQFIVEACNAHEDLLKFALLMRDFFSSDQAGHSQYIRGQADDVIQRAIGKRR